MYSDIIGILSIGIAVISAVVLTIMFVVGLFNKSEGKKRVKAYLKKMCDLFLGLG